MGLESGSFIATLVATNPVAGTDYVSQGDDHIRLIKLALQNSFPRISTTVEATPAELNLLVGATQGIATLSASLAAANASISAINTLLSQMGTLSTSVTSSDITGSIRTPVLQTQAGYTAGTFTAATVVVNNKGIVTGISSGSAGVFTAAFTSAELTLTANTELLGTAHSLGGLPKLTRSYLICKTGEYGYSIGDVIPATTGNASAAGGFDATWANTTNIGYYAQAGFLIGDRSTPAIRYLTLANWKMVIEAWI